MAELPSERMLSTILFYYISFPQSTMVSEALSCITNRLDSIEDTYATALVTYTLMLANHSDASSKMMKLLREKAVKKGRIQISPAPVC